MLFRGDQYNNTNPARYKALSKAHQLEQVLMDEVGLSKEGADFVSQSCNLFSNEPLNVIGMPDETGGKSLVYDIEQTFVVTMPDTMAGAPGEWDANICFHSMFSSKPLNGIDFDLTTSRQAYHASGSTSANPNPFGNGLVHCCAVQTGQPTWTPGEATAEYSATLLSLLTEPGRRLRVIAGALKVINSTAALNKQGSVIYYRVESDICQTRVTDAALTPIEALIGSAPPSTAAKAKQSGGVIMGAEDGALCNFAFSSDQHPVSFVRNVNGVLLQYGDGAGSEPGWSNAVAGVIDPTANREIRVLPFQTSGCYFVGLSKETSLTVTARIIVEEFPVPGSALMALGTHSPPSDDKAMAIISLLQSHTHPGYPASFNSWGTFTNILKSIAKQVYGPAKAVFAATPAGQRLMPTVEAIERSVASGKKALQQAKQVRKAVQKTRKRK